MIIDNRCFQTLKSNSSCVAVRSQQVLKIIYSKNEFNNSKLIHRMISEDFRPRKRGESMEEGATG